MAGLDRFFRPKSVAVVGGAEANRVVDQLDLLGYGGDIWPIHPTRTEMAGRPCVKAVGDLPGPPDVAFVAVPREAAARIVRELSELGAGGAVVYASGFGESGETDLEAELILSAGGMPILGPNTYGYVNALDGTAIWPDVHGLTPVTNGVALITQSGNIGINLTMARRSLDIAMVVTAGNQADVDIPRLMNAFMDDSRITAIGIQIESIEDAQMFGGAALKAASQGIPIVALKMGMSDGGAAITASHTGAMAGDDDAYSALFRYYGVARVESIPTFLETLKLAGVVRTTPRVLCLSASGGEAAHIADLAQKAGVNIPDLNSDHLSTVKKTVPQLVTVTNPMDYHTVSWGDGEALGQTFRALAAGPFDLAMLVLDFPDADIPEAWWTACRAFADSLDGKPGLVVSTLPETMPVAAQEKICSMGLIPMLGVVETIDAIGILGALNPVSRRLHLAARESGDAPEILDEMVSKELIAELGIPIPDGEIVTHPEEATVPFPVTVKVTHVHHKDDFGGVVVGVPNRSTLQSVDKRMPSADLYLVEETVTDGVAELLVSIRSVDDLGWLVTVGNGGTKVEELDDRAHLLAPADASQISGALSRLRIGYRLKEKGADLDSVIETVLMLQEALGIHERVVEVEINPLIVKTAGAIAVDAMVTMS